MKIYKKRNRNHVDDSSHRGRNSRHRFTWKQFGISKLVPDQNIDGIWNTLVGAGALDVARLLAAVAHTLRRCLLGAVARQMADLAA